MTSVAVFAHRGASATHPENTEAAFSEALRLGVEAVELDVHLSADRQMVVIHDETVDRTSDGHGEIRRLSLAEIEELDAGGWFGAEFAGAGGGVIAGEGVARDPANKTLYGAVFSSPNGVKSSY